MKQKTHLITNTSTKSSPPDPPEPPDEMVNITHIAITLINEGTIIYPLHTFRYTEEDLTIQIPGEETFIVVITPYTSITPELNGTAIRFSYTPGTSVLSQFKIPPFSHYLQKTFKGSAGTEDIVRFSLLTSPNQTDTVFEYNSTRPENTIEESSTNDVIFQSASNFKFIFTQNP